MSRIVLTHTSRHVWSRLTFDVRHRRISGVEFFDALDKVALWLVQQALLVIQGCDVAFGRSGIGSI